MITATRILPPTQIDLAMERYPEYADSFARARELARALERISRFTFTQAQLWQLILHTWNPTPEDIAQVYPHRERWTPGLISIMEIDDAGQLIHSIACEQCGEQLSDALVVESLSSISIDLARAIDSHYHPREVS